MRASASAAAVPPPTGRTPRAPETPAGDMVWGLLEQGVGLVASTLTFLLLVRTLGAAGYGAYVGLYAFIGPFLAPTVAGVSLAAMDHIVRAREDPVDVVRSCLSVTAVSSVVSVPILSALALLWIDGLPVVAATLLVGSEFCLNGVVTVFQGVVQAIAGYPAVVRFRMLTLLSKIGVLTVLAAAGSLTLTNLAVGQAVTLAAVVAFGVARVSRLLGAPARPGHVRPHHARSALVYGLGIGAAGIQADADKFVLNAAHHQADAGRYGAAYRLMTIVMIPITALVRVTHVGFLDFAEGANALLRRTIRYSLITAAYAVPAAICLVLVAPLVPKILTKEFAETRLILQLLAPVVILKGVGGFPMNGLMGLGRNALRTKLLVGNALLSVALYAALIPSYAWRGALAATLVSELSLFASAWVALVVSCRRSSPGRP